MKLKSYDENFFKIIETFKSTYESTWIDLPEIACRILQLRVSIQIW